MAHDIRHISGFPEFHLNYRMVSRDADFTTLRARLLETVAYQQRLVVITAIGGTGKTRVAAELAMKTPEFTDGVLWVSWRDDNSGNANEADLTRRLREHLDLPVDSTPDAIWAALTDKRLLIVLDNAESVPFAHRPAIANRLQRYATRGGTRIVMTTRIGWDECDEFAYEHSLDRLSVAAAAQVVKVMADYSGKAEAVAGHETALADKAHRHPLLIKYAIGWLAQKRHTLNDVFKMLEKHNHADIEKMLKDVLLDTLFQIEYGPHHMDYEPKAAADFHRLLVCKGGFTEDAAHALIGEDSPSLGVLRRWNLVSETDGRYTLDPLAEAVLTPDPAAHPVHYEFYLALVRRHGSAQDYLGLDIESDNVAAAFGWAMGAGEFEKAYWLANACFNFLANRGRFEQLKHWLESVAAQLEDYSNEYLKSAVQNDLGNFYVFLPSGNRRENLLLAIRYYKNLLIYISPQFPLVDYATTQNNLGNAYAKLANIEDTNINLHQAIKCYKTALLHRKSKVAPMDYAMTQNNLGNVYKSLASIENEADNLLRAIKCYRRALRYRTAKVAPLDYAMTKSNLGSAYAMLADIKNPITNLLYAIKCYKSALRYRTKNAAPIDYAMTQNNLGNAYFNLASIENPSLNLRQAIASYKKAMRYRTAKIAPHDYAMTKRNLGDAYLRLAYIEEKDLNLQQAIVSYESVLLYYTPQSTPEGYAMTKYKLGNAYLNLEVIGNHSDNLRRAVACYETALEYYTSQAIPIYYAAVQANMGIAYKKLGETDEMCAAWREAEKYFRQVGHLEDAERVAGWLVDAGC